MSHSLWPHQLQHARLLCPSLSPWVCSSSCPLSQWCHPTISFSVAPFSSCPQSFPASGSFPVSQLFASGGQSIGVSASASVQFSSVAQSCLILFDPMDCRLPCPSPTPRACSNSCPLSQCCQPIHKYIQRSIYFFIFFQQHLIIFSIQNLYILCFWIF